MARSAMNIRYLIEYATHQSMHVYNPNDHDRFVVRKDYRIWRTNWRLLTLLSSHRQSHQVTE